MLMHLFKMIWNQKKAHSLIIAEVTIAFIVIFVLVAFAIRYYNAYKTPLGFNYEDMWQINLFTEGQWDLDTDQDTLQQVMAALKQQENIDSAHVLEKPPFEDSSWGSSIDANDRTIDYFVNMIDDGGPQEFGMELIAGRWFGREDVGQNYIAVMVNRQFAEEAFPGEDAVGRSIGDFSRRDEAARERRIVGVFEDFRQFGELSAASPYLFYRYDLVEGSFDGGGISLVQIRVKEGTPITYEEELMRLLQGVAPNWQFGIKQWEAMRESQFRRTMLPYVVFGIVAFFLICMVAMGLFGVLWQNITKRTQEIGVRRALGATAAGVHWQIVTELAVIALLGISVAFVILVQLPIVGIFGGLSWPLFWSSFLIATLFMFTLSVICAYYPGRTATKYVPADALRYE